MYDNFLADKITSCKAIRLPYWTQCQINGCERHAKWKVGYLTRRKAPSFRAGMDRRIPSWISPHQPGVSDPQPIIQA